MQIVTLHLQPSVQSALSRPLHPSFAGYATSLIKTVDIKGPRAALEICETAIGSICRFIALVNQYEESAMQLLEESALEISDYESVFHWLCDCSAVLRRSIS